MLITGNVSIALGRQKRVAGVSVGTVVGTPEPDMTEKLASIEEKFQLAVRTAAEEQAKKRLEVESNATPEEGKEGQVIIIKQEPENSEAEEGNIIVFLKTNCRFSRYLGCRHHCDRVIIENRFL